MASRSAAKHGSLEGMAMRDVVTTVVAPAAPDLGNAEPGFELCSLDLLMPNMYVPLLLLFDASPGPRRSSSGWAGLVEELKQSLAKVLVAFYPLAGRMVQRPHLHLVCNNAGAVFTSARVDAPMSRVYRTGESGVGVPYFQPVGEFSGILMRDALLGELELENSKPALMVQVTGFECGGVALAVNWLHTVADGFAASQFLKAWSDACGGGLGLGLVQLEHGRAQALKEAHLLGGALEFSDQDLAADSDYTPPGLEAVLWTRDMAATLEALAAIATTRQTPILRLIHYTEAGIRKLKAAAAAAAAGPGEHFSTVTCVSAHLWQCLTRARLQLVRETQAKAQGEEIGAGPGTCVAMVAVDAKVRRTTTATATGSCVGPHSHSATLLPASYFGNSILMVRTREVEPEEVARQPLGFAASLIKHSVAGIHLRAFQYLLALADKHGAPNITAMPRAAHSFTASSWYRFPLYDLHFCFQAQPVLAVPNFTQPSPLMDGIAILLPSPLGPNNLTAMLFANESVLANLCLDPEFLDYAY